MIRFGRRAAAVAAIAGGLTLLAGCGLAIQPAALVNGEAISRLEVQREADRVAAQVSAGGRADPVGLRSLALDRLIALRLLRQQARQEGIIAGAAEIDGRIAQLVVSSGGKDQFLDILQSGTLTAPDVRRMVEDMLLSERLIARHVQIPAQVDERRVRHVLVDSADKAAAVRQRLAGGEPWEKVAAEVSADPGSRARGGDLGFLQRGQTVAPFDAAVFSLPLNEISQPVPTSFGYHVLQVTEARSQAPTADQAADLEQRLFSQFLARLRQEATIVVDGVPVAPQPARP